MRAVVSALVLAAMAVLPLRTLHAQKIDTSEKAVVAAAGDWVKAYEKDLAFVLADELAMQQVTRSGSVAAERRTRAEFFLTYLPQEGHWMAARDVREADGATVIDPDDIRALIQRAPLWRLGAIVAEKNARYNIGNVRRTFNEPTFALLVLDALHRRRFRFDRTVVSSGAAPVVTLTFTEKDRPTLISGMFGEPVYTNGELDIDAATGRVQRTRIAMALGPVRAEMTTSYALDQKLGMWVPVSMHERYEQSAGPAPEVITVESTYTNYQRFDATVIIK